MPFTVLSWGNRAARAGSRLGIHCLRAGIVSMLAIIATGVDDFSAFASVVATLNNLGPGLGD